MTFIIVGVKVSYLFRLTLAANLVAHTLKFGDGGLILCWSRIRKNVTHREQRTENKHTEKAIAEAHLIPWSAGLGGQYYTYMQHI